MWGDTSVGKSPLGWAMAGCIATGQSFCGLPTQKGKALYIELDTPERLVAERLRKLRLQPEAGADFLFLPPLSVPVLAREDLAKLHEAAERGYDLVVINTLRKCHSLNDKEAQTPKIVYEFFQRAFPGAALMFVHHSKKSQLNQTSGQYESGLDKESFSGAKNWINDAQVGIYLRKFKNPRTGTNLVLRHEKTQVSAEYTPLPLRLEPDGSNLSCPEAEMLEAVRVLLGDPAVIPLGPTRKDEYIAGVLRQSQATARRLRLACDETVWLALKDDSQEEEEE
jgi:hypothetical protein